MIKTKRQLRRSGLLFLAASALFAVFLVRAESRGQSSGVFAALAALFAILGIKNLRRANF